MPAWREATTLLVLYAALAVWWLWPLPTAWSTHSAYLSRWAVAVADFHLIVWVLAWDAHALVTAPWRLFNANTFFPSPDSLAYSEHLLGYAPLFAPTWWLTGNPILAVNLMVFATYPLSALAMYALARRFTAPPAAAVAGLLYAFHPWRYLQPPHVHMLGVFWLPLALLAAERWLERARVRDALLLCVASAMQCLSSVYLAFATAIALGPYLVLALLRWRQVLDARRAAGLVVSLAVAAGVVAWSMLPYLRMRDLGLIPSFASSTGRGAIGLFFSLIHVREYLRAESIGPIGWVLALVAVAPPWRRRLWPCALGVTFALVGTVAAVGRASLLHQIDTAVVFRFLADRLPGFDAIRVSARFVVVTQLGLALLAGVGLHRLLRRLEPVRAAVAAAVVGVALLAGFGHLPPLPLHDEVVPGEVDEAYRWLAAKGEGRSLLELPAGAGFAGKAQRMLLSTYHWLPAVDGYSAYAPRSANLVYAIARHLPHGPALQRLVDTIDLGWILVHLDELPAGQRESWEKPLPPGLVVAGRFGDDLLLRVTRPADVDRQARLLRTSETIEGVPLAPLAGPCPGELRVVAPPPSEVAAREPMRVAVAVRNDGDAPWPAFGLYPKHLVMLEVSLVGARDDRSFGRREVSLPLDVLPGRTVKASFRMRAPFLPGEYVLRLALVQVSDGPLDRCGVAGLEVPLTVTPPARTGPAPPAAPS